MVCMRASPVWSGRQPDSEGFPAGLRSDSREISDGSALENNARLRRHGADGRGRLLRARRHGGRPAARGAACHDRLGRHRGGVRLRLRRGDRASARRPQQRHSALHQMGHGRRGAARRPRRRDRRHRQGAEGLPGRRHQMVREPQIRAGQTGPRPARLAAAHRRADLSILRFDRRHSRRLCRQCAIHGRDGALALDLGQRHQ